MWKKFNTLSIEENIINIIGVVLPLIKQDNFKLISAHYFNIFLIISKSD